MSSVKKKKNKLMKNKKTIIIILVVALAIILLLLGSIFLLKGGSDNSTGRCYTDEYNISSKTFKKVEEKIKEIPEVNKVSAYKNVCSIKILINLAEDVDLEIIKENMNEVLEILGEDILSNFDILLYVTSDNKESEVYPLNVAKNKLRDNFAW